MADMWRHSKRNIELLQAYVDESAERMGLSHYTIVCERELPDRWSDTIVYARINREEFRRAYLRVYRGFFGRDEEWKRNTIAHELLHLVMKPIADTADLVVECAKTVPPGPWKGINLSMRVLSRAEEDIVEHLEPLLGMILAPFPVHK